MDSKRTPIHFAASEGKMKVTMLLLEVGADMNARDSREYTAVAHAEANNHFALMDRLVLLGGKGHALQKGDANLGRSSSAKKAGELVVSAGMLKSSSLGDRQGAGEGHERASHRGHDLSRPLMG